MANTLDPMNLNQIITLHLDGFRNVKLVPPLESHQHCKHLYEAVHGKRLFF